VEELLTCPSWKNFDGNVALQVMNRNRIGDRSIVK
jgi:hypothetical protein